eukprot:4650449-Alexandrium_andersonii.AAC.1
MCVQHATRACRARGHTTHCKVRAEHAEGPRLCRSLQHQLPVLGGWQRWRITERIARCRHQATALAAAPSHQPFRCVGGEGQLAQMLLERGT